MRFDPDKNHRRSIRLRGYDYTRAGAYFVTICTQNRECLFGNIVEGEIRLNDAGHVVQSVWNELPQHYPGVDVDAFVVMPNHIHGIIVLMDGNIVGAGLKPAPYGNNHRRGQSHPNEPAWFARNCAGIQNVFIPPHQSMARDTRCARLAAQLLRTCNPQ